MPVPQPPGRLFIDTHAVDNGTLPAGLDETQFAAFHAQYLDACAAEGVTPLNVAIGLSAGRAFCLTMAPDAEAVRRAHERVGLPFDSITEVTMASQDAVFLRPQA